jgi:hypothetical protein
VCVYVDNGKFIPRNRKYILPGGRIQFNCDPDKQFNTYKTFGELTFYHTCREYSTSGINTSLAFTRLSNTRFLDEPGLHELLEENQSHGVTNPWFVSVLRELHCDIVTHFLNATMPADKELEQHAYTAHTKKKVRVVSFLEILATGTLYTIDWLLSAKGNVKPFEWAKQGKLPRMVVDLTCKGSLYAGWVFNQLKVLLTDNPIIRAGARARFVPKANLDPLRRVFTDAISSIYWLEFFFHSDDGFFRFISHDGVTYFVEIDIASCDTSHTRALFDVLSSLSPDGWAGEFFHIALKQLTLPIKLINRENRKESVTFDMLETAFALYSGSVATTYLNCLALILVFCIILSSDIRDCVGVSEVQKCVYGCGLQAGYKLTVHASEDVRDVVFLKHSSTKDGSPWLNLGVMLRVLGCCRGDYPKIRGWPSFLTTFAAKARSYQISLVQCFCHAGSSCVTRALRAKYHSSWSWILPREPPSSFKTGHYLLDSMRHDPGVESWVPDSDILHRYNIEQADLDELIHFISGANGACMIDCAASRAIYTKDYGIKYT